MKLQALWVLGLLLAAGPSLAQMNNNQYHRNQQQIQNRNHMAEQHRQGYMTQQQQMQQQPPQPTGWWEKTWGAIAPSPNEGAVGVAVGANSKEDAEQQALADCKARGGGGCVVNLTYHNQCAAMVVGEKWLKLYGAGSIEKASQLAMSECKKNDTNCRVYYSACTEPIFHRY